MTDLPIPPEWLAAAHEWAPHVLAALLLTTALVHLALPVARRVELWAITTPAAWDDGPARRTVAALEWLASALPAVLAWLPRLAVGPRAPRPPVDPPPPPPASGAALLVLALALASVTQGCGAGAIGQHATAALYTTHAVRVGGEVVDRARARALDQVSEDASPEQLPAALRTEAERWQPVGASLDLVRETLRAWVDAIDLARIAGEDDIALMTLLPLAARAVSLYGRVVTLAASLGEDGLPTPPPWLVELAGGVR